MRNKNCDDYEHNHCDDCNGNETSKSICNNCKLRVGNYCFCGDEPEKLTEHVITECDYFFKDSKYTCYEFIDGYEHCNKLKNIALHKTVQELLNKIKELENG